MFTKLTKVEGWFYFWLPVLKIQAEIQVAKGTFTTLGKKDEMPLYSSRNQKQNYLVWTYQSLGIFFIFFFHMAKWRISTLAYINISSWSKCLILLQHIFLWIKNYSLGIFHRKLPNSRKRNVVGKEQQQYTASACILWSASDTLNQE